MKVKEIIILGSTGSIGTQALDVISSSDGRYRVKALVAGNNYKLLAAQAKEHQPETIIIANHSHFSDLRSELSSFKGNLLCGMDEIESYVAGSRDCLVLAAMVGFAGLRPVIAALNAGLDVALANKETLVVAGELVSALAKKSGAKILPVDSEHSAIYQCLTGEQNNDIETITLTASGGPFRGFSHKELERVTPEMALKHPNWSMGSKVTIDSATLMNKGLEMIEAHWLFNTPSANIEVVIHPQSIVHSFVTFRDGSVKAQLGMPDMRFPISYAFSYPARATTKLPRTDFTSVSPLTFEKPDRQAFRNLDIAYRSLEQGGNVPCIMNAANEIAVEAFLGKRIGFNMIPDVIEEVIKNITFDARPGLEDLFVSDNAARSSAVEIINKLPKQI